MNYLAINYLTHPLDLAKDLVNRLMNRDTKCDKEVKPEVCPAPSASAVRQWGVRAQENLAHYQRTGELPEKMFIFD
jgi:hypothetical protein